jgi:hypothetical protein
MHGHGGSVLGEYREITLSKNTPAEAWFVTIHSFSSMDWASSTVRQVIGDQKMNLS